MASAIVGTLRAILTLDTAEFRTESAKVSASAKAFSKDFKTLGQQATSLGSTLTKTLTLPLAGLAVGAGKAAIDFESSFAGVRKTVNATEPEFAAMAKQFRELALQIPINVNELNRLGEAAGALGIPKAEIVDFSRVMALLGVTTNVTSDQAAESIAKIQNIFGAAGKDTERFASTLVALGNDGASTESQILEMATRIAGAGNAIGLTQGQVLGFANALSSVGIEAEMGGSAISRVFIDIASAVSQGGDTLQDFAAVSGMTSAQFSKAFKDDAARATAAFIAGLTRTKESGGDLLGTLEALGFSEIRVRDTLLRAAGAGDLLTRSLDLQQTAWQTNTALTGEAGERFKTTASQLTTLWGAVRDVGIELGIALKPAIDAAIGGVKVLAPYVKAAAEWFGGLPGPVQLTALGFLAAAAAAGPLLLVVGQTAFALQGLTAAFTANGIATKILTGNAIGLSTALAFVGKAVSVVGVAWAGWNIGKWIGEVTGATNGVEWLAGRLMGLTTEQILAGRKAREQAEAHKAQAEAASGAADIATQLAEAQAHVQRETDKARAALTGAVDITRRHGAANKELEQAAKQAAEALNRERDAVKGLGLVTERDLNGQLEDMQVALNRATAEGVPLYHALSAILPKLQGLAVEAKASGIPLDDLNAIIGDVTASIQALGGALPSLNGKIATIDLMSLGGGMATVTSETMRAGKEAYLTGEAFKYFGLTTREELDRTAIEARQHYDDLVASGEATAEQLDTAWAAVLEAEKRGRKESVSYWKQWADRVIGIGQSVVDGFAAALLGIKGQTAQEHERMAEDAKAAYERTEQTAREAQARAEESARQSHERTTQDAIDQYGRETEAAQAKYDALVVAADGNAEAIRDATIWLAMEQQRIDEEKNAKLTEASVVLNDALALAAEEATTEIERSHADMVAAIEEASHPFRDNLRDIWNGIKDDFKSVITDMLGDFIQRFIGGAISSLLGNKGAFGNAFSGMFSGFGGGLGGGSGVPSIGAYGASAGYGGGAGVGAALGAAGLGVAAAGAGYTLGKVGYEWVTAAFGDHYISPGANYERQVHEARQQADYMGMSFEDYMASGMGGWMDQPQGFIDGTHGMYADFGAGTMAMLHNDEAVVPKAYAPTLAEDIAGALRGFGSGAPREMRIVIERDGRSEAEWLVPFLPGAQERLQFA